MYYANVHNYVKVCLSRSTSSQITIWGKSCKCMECLMFHCCVLQQHLFFHGKYFVFKMIIFSLALHTHIRAVSYVLKNLQKLQSCDCTFLILLRINNYYSIACESYYPVVGLIFVHWTILTFAVYFLVAHVLLLRRDCTSIQRCRQ